MLLLSLCDSGLCSQQQQQLGCQEGQEGAEEGGQKGCEERGEEGGQGRGQGPGRQEGKEINCQPDFSCTGCFVPVSSIDRDIAFLFIFLM
jgi:hypothetical protein